MAIKKPTEPKIALLHLLSDGQPHSIATISNKLTLTDDKIQSIVKALQHQGVDIDTPRSNYYCIPSGLCLLDKSLIMGQLTPTTRQTLARIDCLDSVTSTNDYLLACARTDYNTNSTQNKACFAEQQTNGRGQYQRRWISPYANNIYHSLLWYSKNKPSQLTGLSLAVAVCVIRTLNKLGISNQLQLKWPNDILWQSQKLSGILIETLIKPQGCCALIIGIGINTRLTQQSERLIIDQPAISTEAILNRPTDRNQLAATLLNTIIAGLQQFERTGLANFINEWQNLDYCINKKVRLQSRQQQHIGMARGISPNGELLLETANGKISHHCSGQLRLYDA